jgi:hypothetical protein
VTFGEGGGWAQPRVLTVQFQNIQGNSVYLPVKRNSACQGPSVWTTSQ